MDSADAACISDGKEVLEFAAGNGYDFIIDDRPGQRGGFICVY